MRRGEERRRNRSGDLAAAGVDLHVSCGDRCAVQTDLCAGDEARAEELNSGEIGGGRKRPLWNGRFRDTADDSGAGSRAGNDYFGDFGSLEGVGVSRGWAQSNNLNSTAARFHDEGLIGDRIDSNTAPQSERTSSAVRDCDLYRTGAGQSDLRGSNGCGGTGTYRAGERTTRSCHGIGDRDLVDGPSGDAWIVGNDGVCVGLPCECGRALQLRAAGAGRGISRACGGEVDRTEGLIERVEKVDLSGGCAGIGECGGIGDGIDGNALGGRGKAAKNEIGASEENGAAAGTP